MAIGAFAFTAGAVLLLAYTDTDIGDAELSSKMVPIATQHLHLSKARVAEFNKTGLLVIKNVLSDVQLADARAAAQLVVNEGRLDTVVGNAADVRQDTVCFVRASDGTITAGDKKAREYNTLGPGLSQCIEMLRGTPTQLERLGYDRSTQHRVPLQCQLAQYAGNGRALYMAHRDAAADDNFFEVGLLGWFRGSDYRQRSITAILYLNDAAWDSAPGADGGALKCYIGADQDDHSGETATSVVRVNPAGGTLVLFDSRYLLHEVEPSNKDRLALTLWVVGKRNDAHRR